MYCLYINGTIYLGSEGGISAAGSVIVFSAPATLPSHSDGTSAAGATVANPYPGFIAEVDRYGGLMRTANADLHLNMLAQSNHFIEYGVDGDDAGSMNPTTNFGQAIGFSSRFR